jgi:hypothetical protein
MTLPHRYYINKLVEEAARDVWRSQMEGIIKPIIAVKLNSQGPRSKLVTTIAVRDEPVTTNLIAIFAGEAKNWQEEAKRWQAALPDRFAGWSLAAIYDRLFEGPATAGIKKEIWSALRHKGKRWLRAHGLDPDYGPGAMLNDYLQRGDVTPAVMLAHAILCQWTHELVIHNRDFLNLSARLLRYRNPKNTMQTSRDRQRLAQVVSRCLAVYSHRLNDVTRARFAARRPLTQVLLRIHKKLLRLPFDPGWDQVTFTHVPDPGVTSMLL